MIFLLMLNFAMADFITNPYNKKVYKLRSDCPGQCFDIGSGGSILDPEIHSVVDGKLVLDQVKVDQKQAAKNAETIKKNARAARLLAIKTLSTKSVLTPTDISDGMRALLTEVGGD